MYVCIYIYIYQKKCKDANMKMKILHLFTYMIYLFEVSQEKVWSESDGFLNPLIQFSFFPNSDNLIAGVL